MSRARRLLPYVLLVALAARVAAAFAVEAVVAGDPGREFLIPGDAEGYWHLARTIAAGDDFAVHDPPRYALRMPGFPFVLAIGMTLTGGSRLGTRIWLALVGTLACGLVHLLGRELFDEATALVATAFTAVAPLLVGFSVLVLSETAFAAAMLGSLLVLARLFRPRVEGRVPRRTTALLAGLAIAVAVYLRPAWLLAAPVFVVIDVVRSADRRAAAVRGGLLFAGLAAGLAPWTIRNGVVFGRFVPTTLWLGPTLYDGLHPGADGGSDMRFFEEDRESGLTRGLDEYQIDRFYRRRTFEYAVGNPSRVAWLAVAKQARFWSAIPNAGEFRRPAGIAAVLVCFVPMIVLGLRGLYLSRRSLRVWVLGAGPLLYFAGLHLVFVGSIRYRLPAEYPFWIVASAGLLAWCPAWHRWLSATPGEGATAHPGAAS